MTRPEADLSRLREVAAGATPGEWLCEGTWWLEGVEHDVVSGPEGVEIGFTYPGDSTFIVTARNEWDALLDEIETLRHWKAEALPVIGGLQELGRALGLRLGTSITGPAAAEKASELRGEVEALRATVARVRVAVELVTQDVRAQRGDHIAGLVEDSFAAHFARAALTDPSGEGK